MIKQSQTVLLPCLSKLFNSFLSHGKYPQSWAEGYISVIHKSGDAADPDSLTLYDSLSSPRDWKWDNHLDGATAEL
jgi:hypothetical protein